MEFRFVRPKKKERLGRLHADLTNTRYGRQMVEFSRGQTNSYHAFILGHSKWKPNFRSTSTRRDSRRTLTLSGRSPIDAHFQQRLNARREYGAEHLSHSPKYGACNRSTKTAAASGLGQ